MGIHKSQQTVNGALQQLKLISRHGQKSQTIVGQFIENANIILEAREDTENKNYDLFIETNLSKLKAGKKKQHFD